MLKENFSRRTSTGGRGLGRFFVPRTIFNLAIEGKALRPLWRCAHDGLKSMYRRGGLGKRYFTQQFIVDVPNHRKVVLLTPHNGLAQQIGAGRLCGVLAVVDDQRTHTASDHEARSGSGVDEVIDRPFTQRHLSVSRWMPCITPVLTKSTGCDDRRLWACSFGVAQRQFSGEYPLSLSIRSSVSPARYVGPMSAQKRSKERRQR